MLIKLLCRKDNSIFQAMQIINENGKNTVFVVDHQDRLCGVLTDGDIRRSLLSGKSLHEQVSKVIAREFKFIRQSEGEKAYLKNTDESIKIMPVVDDDMRVVDFFQFTGALHVPVAHPDLTGSEFKYLSEAFLSSWISSRGEYINMFERGFSQFCGTRYGVAVCNGTAALHLALLASGIGPGDEVIIPDLTFAATINAVLHAQATPVIVDVDKTRWCIDPAAIQSAVTRKTKAIIPVHLYGQPCDMDAVMAIAKKHRLKVIEDCAEAHGAEYGGQKVGSFGDIGCFSFFANKIVTTGEGGMCVTNSASLMEKMRLMRDHGMSKTKKYWHTVVGYNYRMTNLQAAIGVAQIERIDAILKERDNIEAQYREQLKGLDFVAFPRRDLPKSNKVVWLVSVVLTDGKRDTHMERLIARKIEVRPFFYPLSRMPIYKKYAQPCRNSRWLSARGINFPTVSWQDRNQMFRDIIQTLSTGKK